MSYIPPHLRDRTSQPAQRRLPDRSSPQPTSRNTGLSTSRHAHGPSTAPSPRPSRRFDTTSVLESNPDDIKPRRLDGGPSRGHSESKSVGNRLMTEMDLLGTVSRSGGVGDENDALKDFAIQEKYRIWIQSKLDDYEKRFPEFRSTQIDASAQEALEIMNNILIYLRKLREGLIASRRLDEFAIEVYETSALYAIKARNHPQIISSLSVLIPNAYRSASRSYQIAKETEQPLSARLQQLDINDSVKGASDLKPPNRKGLFTSLLLLYDIVYRQSPRDFMTRFFSLTEANVSSQGRRRWQITEGKPVFIEAQDPHMRYAWDVQQAISQTSVLRFNALAQPLVRLRQTSHSSSLSEENIYATDPHQRIILSWATEGIRQQSWNIAQKAYHPQLGLGLEWCARLLLFSHPVAKGGGGAGAGDDDEDGDGRDSADMREWITSHGGRIENAKVFPT